MRTCRTCGGFGWTGTETNHLKRQTCQRCEGRGKIPDTYEHVSKPVSRVLENLERPSSQLGSRDE